MKWVHVVQGNVRTDCVDVMNTSYDKAVSNLKVKPKWWTQLRDKQTGIWWASPCTDHGKGPSNIHSECNDLGWWCIRKSLQEVQCSYQYLPRWSGNTMWKTPTRVLGSILFNITLCIGIRAARSLGEGGRGKALVWYIRLPPSAGDTFPHHFSHQSNG